jgi:hypothetical protein
MRITSPVAPPPLAPDPLALAPADALPEDDASSEGDADAAVDVEAEAEADGDVALLADVEGAVLAAPEVDGAVDAPGVLPAPQAAKIGNMSAARPTQTWRLVRWNIVWELLTQLNNKNPNWNEHITIDGRRRGAEMCAAYARTSST